MCTTHATLPRRTAVLHKRGACGRFSTLSWANGSIATTESTRVMSRSGNDLMYLLGDPGRPVWSASCSTGSSPNWRHLVIEAVESAGA